jgi:uncharacterized protein YjiS (DUF1127 family)
LCFSAFSKPHPFVSIVSISGVFLHLLGILPATVKQTKHDHPISENRVKHDATRTVPSQTTQTKRTGTMNIALTAETYSRTGAFLGAAFAKHISEMRERSKQKQQARSLRSLDDRTLRDMGVDRSEIFSIVYADPDERRINYARN